MSRIGKLPIQLPLGVSVNISEKNLVVVKGPLGKLSQFVDPIITIKLEDDQIVLERHSEQKTHKAKHGLYRSLLFNMV